MIGQGQLPDDDAVPSSGLKIVTTLYTFLVLVRQCGMRARSRIPTQKQHNIHSIDTFEYACTLHNNTSDALVYARHFTIIDV